MSSFGSFSGETNRSLNSEINMVPLIDVMLVLLIVFMITAPLLTHSVKIDLPQAASQATENKPEVVALSINEAGQLFWNNEPIDDATLPVRLGAAAAQTPQPELHLHADRETRYQKLAEVMSLAREAGVEKMGFITMPGDQPAP